jgi:hypothetical protein
MNQSMIIYDKFDTYHYSEPMTQITVIKFTFLFK